MKPSRVQQALAGLAVLFVVGMTILGGIVLALGDNSSAAERATATPYRIPTLAPTDAALLTPIVQNSPAPGTQPPTITPAPPQAMPTPLPPVTGQPTATARPAVATAASTCYTASGWQPYVVRAGDTLFEIGLHYGATVDMMEAGNCFAGDSLEVGQTIYVPPVTPNLSPASTQTLSPVDVAATANAPTGYGGSCSSSNSVITAPPVGAALSGVVKFYGTATSPDFQFYKLEIRPEDSTEADFVTFETFYEQVSAGFLGQVNSAAFANGNYWIRLVVVDQTGNYLERCSLLYTIKN